MNPERGHLTVVYGPMFAGKTTEIINRYREAQDSGQHPQVFKPTLDDRYGDSSYLWSHDKDSVPATKYDANNPEQIKELLDPDALLLLLDEIQFAAPGIISVVEELLAQGKTIVAVGLDLDSDQQPFGQTLALAKQAETVVQKYSTCYQCGEQAPFTKALFEKNDQVIVVGAAEKYVPSCSKHHKG